MSAVSKNAPLISVITVCFNAAEFIEQAIQSVIAQTYSNIEYILIDGGSSDGTVDIIRQYESHLAYWHSKSDRGLAYAFNLGLVQAHGEWIFYLHADDYFLEDSAIDKMVPYLIRYKDADVVFGEVHLISRQKDVKLAPFRKIFGSPWKWEQFRCKDTLPHQAAFTNQRYFVRVGEFDENYKIALDYEHYLRGGRGLKAHYIPIAISVMRRGGLSQRDIIKTWREGRRAQIKTKALPEGLAQINFVWQLGRSYLSLLIHKLIDKTKAELYE